MDHFRSRILYAFIIFASGIFLLLGLLIANLSIGSMERQQMDAYERQLKLTAHSIDDNGRLQSTLRKYSEEVEGELSYVSEDGKLLATTLPKENRPETDRFVTNSNEMQEYERDGFSDFVLPITPDSPSSDQLVMTISENEMKSNLRRAWIPILLTIILGYVILIIVTFRLTQKLAKPVDDAMRVANELARGNYKARSHEYQLKETGQLNHSLNVLARNLEHITRSREAERERMKTVIENMDSALLLIDSNGYINLINRAYQSIFQIEGDYTEERLYYEIMPNHEVVELVGETFLTEAMVRKQVSLTVGIERKHFLITCVPIIGKKEKITGIVLVFHDITELKQLEQMRKDFVANVSHELRTPVTSLKGFTETLLDGAMENEELRKKFLTIIWKESDRLQNLIQDLLDFSKMEQSNFQLNWQTINLETIIDDVKTLLESRADEKDITLGVELQGNLLLEGDAARIKQVLINLVNNALAYTPIGGRVTIKSWDEEESVHLIVEDTGIGMNKEEIPRIFERFYRIDKARSRNSGGTGLGLAIVKHLVEAHHGLIHVSSEKEVGTTFKLTFAKHQDK